MKYCTNGVQNIIKTSDDAPCGLLKKRKFHNAMGGVVLKDVAPCGGMCPNSFIKKLNFPLTIAKFCNICVS